MGIQQLLRTVFPTQCINCQEPVEKLDSLCGRCWSDVPLISGTACVLCGLPLDGPNTDGAPKCDSCLEVARPWKMGHAACLYAGLARKMLLKFKHADRTDLAPVFAKLMASRARDLVTRDTVITNVPAHWQRRLMRRYDQAEVLATALSREIEQDFCPNALRRMRTTIPQENMTFEERCVNVERAFAAQRTKAQSLSGKSILLVDDVMTSGATLSSATSALLKGGAREVRVIVLARVAKGN